MTLGQRIKNLRKQKNMTQEDLGKILGVTKVSISGYENDTREPDNKSLIKLSNFFNVTTDYLLGRNKTPQWATQEDTNDLAEFLAENSDTLMYQGEKMTREDKEKLEVALTQIFWKYREQDKKE